jgi:hypothetical protein
MGSLEEKLRAAQTVGLDSAIFIYYFEGHSRYKELCYEQYIRFGPSLMLRWFLTLSTRS